MNKNSDYTIQVTFVNIFLLSTVFLVIDGINKHYFIFDLKSPFSFAAGFLIAHVFIACLVSGFLYLCSRNKDAFRVKRCLILFLWITAAAESYSAYSTANKVVDPKERVEKKRQDEFVDNKDGTVTFKANGLTWQKCSVGQTWNGETCSGEATEMTWSDAMSLSSNFYGYNDWRFPTVDELKTLIFCSDNEYKIDGSCTNSKEVTKPTIDLVYFPNMPKYSSYWSSSPYIGDNSLAYVVHFGFGNSYLGNKYDNHYFVRWVRYSHHDK